MQLSNRRVAGVMQQKGRRCGVDDCSCSLCSGVMQQQGRRSISSFAEYTSPVNGAPRLPSPWNKWFPYEPVPCSPQQTPYAVKCQVGEAYHWCSCGECVSQPFCDDAGGKGGCASRGFTAVRYVPKHTGTKYFCGCKHCNSAPLFNGTCWLAWIDYNIVPASMMGFGSCFVFGVFLTWMVPP